MAITLEEANRIIHGALAKAAELNIQINVAVCDAGGRLVAFNRMDGAIWGGVYGAQGKAVASAAFGRTSGELQGAAGSPIISGIIAAEGGHAIPSQGRCRLFAMGRWKALAASAAAPPKRMRIARPPGLPCSRAII